MQTLDASKPSVASLVSTLDDDLREARAKINEIINTVFNNAVQLAMLGGLTVGSPTGGYLGVGTINADSVVAKDGIEYFHPGSSGVTDIVDYVDTEIQSFAVDIAAALVADRWHSAVGWTRNSANAAGDATAQQLTNFLLAANTLGANDALEIISLWSMTESANAKSIKIIFGAAADGTGGTAYCNQSVVSKSLVSAYTLISAKNATNSQLGAAAASATGFAQNASAVPVTSAIDTTVNTYISFQANWAGAVAGETIKLERYLARIIHV